MSRGSFARLAVLCIFSLITPAAAFAHSGGDHHVPEAVASDGKAAPWFFDFTFEQRNWNEKDPRAAHQLHHAGHDFHDKTHEEFYRWAFGAHPTESITLEAELPYVVRGSLEIDDHDRLGEKEESSGLGDLTLTGVWRFWNLQGGSLGALAGVKFPTGSTMEENSQGVRFEPELQPGSGSYDYTAGAVFERDFVSFELEAQAAYTFTTEGGQEFEAGDAFELDVEAGFPLHPALTLGLGFEFEWEEKEKEAGVRFPDSGGVTLSLGPSARVKLGENSSLFGEILFPVYQNLGGVHQELDFTWSAGAELRW